MNKNHMLIDPWRFIKISEHKKPKKIWTRNRSSNNFADLNTSTLLNTVKNCYIQVVFCVGVKSFTHDEKNKEHFDKARHFVFITAIDIPAELFSRLYLA